MAIAIAEYGLYLLATCLIVLAFAPLISPLRSIPGPFVARYTRLWFLFRVWRGRFDLDTIALHKKYGHVFRFGPYHYCFNDPEAIKIIYGKGTEFDKSSWYEAWNAPGFKSMFTEPSVKAHGQLRRKFQATYTMSSMISYESFADHCIAILCQRLDEIAKSSAGSQTDLARWLLSYAGDAVSMITFSKRMGFLDTGGDVEGFFETLHSNTVYSSLVGIFSEIHAPIFNLSALMNRIGLTGGTPRMFIARFSSNAIEERRKERASSEKSQDRATEIDESAPKDFLNKFLDSHEQDSTKFTERDINVGLLGNVVAGADTTAAALTAIFYCLLKNPATLQKLREEISEAREAGNLASPPTFKEGYALPYLQAVIQEAMRMHAPVGLPLQRVVPSGGYHISGHFFPAGTVVGVSVPAIHIDTSIFGNDAATFRPERWLDQDKEKVAIMQRYWMPFGLGSRTCIGKNISLLEITKMVPEVVTRFDFELADGLEKEGNEMEWYDMWFVRPVALPVKVSLRQEQNS